MKLATEICEICNESKCKYKCPKCLTGYCSLPCFKKHKEVTCKPQENKAPPSDQSTTIDLSNRNDQVRVPELELDESEDKVPLETLDKLNESKHLVQLLSNKHLQNLLTHVDQSEQPGKAIEKAMQEPLFLEFVDECLMVTEPSSPES